LFCFVSCHYYYYYYYASSGYEDSEPFSIFFASSVEFAIAPLSLYFLVEYLRSNAVPGNFLLENRDNNGTETLSVDCIVSSKLADSSHLGQFFVLGEPMFADSHDILVDRTVS
jgi:hypothetical protein